MSLTGMTLGNYRLKKRIYQHENIGVYLAEKLQAPQEEVAIKVSQTDIASFSTNGDINEAVKQFKREAEIVSKLQHEYILPLEGYGEEIIDSIIYIYLVMPYKKDRTLEAWLDAHAGNIKLEDASHIIHMASEALQYVHNQSIIHSDIKPSNFLIEYKNGQSYPHIFLSDFGMAKITNNSLTTRRGGTPKYMPPEQWAGNLTKKSDQYALAIIAYQLLTGRLPFEGNDTAELIRQHKSVMPPRPSKLNQKLKLHPSIDDVILKALAKKPRKRYPSMDIFAAKFHDAIRQSIALNNTQALRQINLPPLNIPLPPPPHLPPPHPHSLKIVFLTCILALMVVSAVVIVPPWIRYKFISLPGTATAVAHLTATSNTSSHIAATASATQAIAQATATAIAHVTATAGVIQTATTGTPKYSFPLTTTKDVATTNAKWDGSSSSNSSCTFAPDGYHVSVNATIADPQLCLETGLPFPGPFSTYTISVDMLIKDQSSSGLVFNIDNSNYPFPRGYFLEVSPSTQRYKFSVLNCTDASGHSCPAISDWQTSSSIHTGSQVNLLQVIINGDNFSFYINGVYLYIPFNSQQDILFTNGYLGLASAIKKGKGEAIFTKFLIYSPNPNP